MKQFVIKTGFYETLRKGFKQAGLDLTRAILDALVFKGILAATDCCTYTVVGSAISGEISTLNLGLTVAEDDTEAEAADVEVGQVYVNAAGTLLVRLT